MDKIKNYNEELILNSKKLGVLEYKLSLLKELNTLDLPPDIHIKLIDLINKNTE